MRLERQVLFWVAAALGLLLVVWLLREILLPFVAGIVIAYFLNPLAERLQRLGLNRLAAAAVMVAGGALLVGLALVLVLPIAAEQLKQLAETLPADLARFKTVVEGWAQHHLGDRLPTVKAGIERAVGDLGQGGSAAVAAVVQSLWTRGTALLNFFSLILITPVVVFYLLVDWHPMLDKIDSWLPRAHAPTIRKLAGDINAAVSAFIRGQGTICLILGAFYALTLTVAGIPYGFLIGIATGILAFVPFVGWALGFAVAAAVALAQSWPELGAVLKVVGIFATGMAVDSVLLSPKIVGEKVGLHPVWLMFALFAFSYLFGFVGVLLAVPIAAAVGVLVRFAIELYLGSSVYRGSGPGAPSA